MVIWALGRCVCCPGAPRGRLNCAPSLNDSALERRAPCGSDRVLCLQHVFPAPLQGGPLRAEGKRRPTNGKLTPGPSLTALLSRTHSPRSSAPAPAPACVPAPWLHRGPEVGQGTGCCRGRCWPQPAKWGLEMAPGLLSMCPSCLQPHPAVGRELWPLSPRAPVCWPSPESRKALHDHLSLQRQGPRGEGNSASGQQGSPVLLALKLERGT